MKYLFTLLFLISCSHKTVDSKPLEPIESLRIKHESLLAEAELLKDKDGWLAPESCDGMEYSSLASAGGLTGFNVHAAEYDDSGRYRRRPIECWYQDREVNESASTWSRDMAWGLMTYLFRSNLLDLAVNHAKYGMVHGWKMGEPTGDFRVFYTPEVIGTLYQIIYALGGNDNGNRNWPAYYPPYLSGYEVNLLLLSINLRGEINGYKDDHDTISSGMFKRIKDYADRDSDDTLAWVMYGIYSGVIDHGIDNCLNEVTPKHVEEKRNIQLAYLLFACSLPFRHMK